MLTARLARGDLPTRPPLPPLHLHLVGRGSVAALALPEAVKSLTTVHFNERYPQYYEQVSTQELEWGGRGRTDMGRVEREARSAARYEHAAGITVQQL
jgi:hypothetical protein